MRGTVYERRHMVPTLTYTLTFKNALTFTQNSVYTVPVIVVVARGSVVDALVSYVGGGGMLVCGEWYMRSIRGRGVTLGRYALRFGFVLLENTGTL